MLAESLGRLPRFVLIAAALLPLAVVVARALGPSDIGSKDQPKTIAYTVDMAQHGPWSTGNRETLPGRDDDGPPPPGWSRLVLPYDMLGRPSTKPPLYNWLALPVVGGFDIYTEWAFKLPSIVTGWLMVAMTVWAGAWMVRESRQAIETDESARDFVTDPRLVGGLAGLIVVSVPTVVSLIYVARPDMVLGAALVGGWLGVTLSLRGGAGHRVGGAPPDAAEPPGSDRPVTSLRLDQLTTWLCFTAAALAKGPPALLIPIYAVVAARPIGGSWGALRRTGMAWGLPMGLIATGLWLWAAYAINPDYVREGMIGEQMLSRVDGYGDEVSSDPAQGAGMLGTALGYFMGLVSTSWQLPFYFLSRGAPWGGVFVAVLLGWWFGRARVVAWPMLPCVLWAAVVFGFFNLSVFKRDDYLLPVYPAVAIAIAWGLLVVKPTVAWHRGTAVALSLASVLTVCGVLYNDWYISDERAKGYGEATHAFADAIRGHTSPLPQKLTSEGAWVSVERRGIVFIDTGYHPLQALLGINQASHRPSETQRAGAGWLVAPPDHPEVRDQAHGHPIFVSDPLPDVHGSEPAPLGLYLYIPQTTNEEINKTPG